MNGPDSQRRKLWRVLGTTILIVALFGILAASVWLALRTWVSAQGAAPISPAGYAWMTFCFVGMLLVGCALIALMFYSSSHGYDEREGRE